jgi:C-terminal processing protease CtpA/Prc
MVIGRLDEPDMYYYAKPVVVLMDGHCFSATDVFLAAVKDRPNVTLIKMASAGSSGVPQTFLYPGKTFGVRISQALTYQADGTLLEGNGVEPDIVVEPTPAFFTGGQDAALARAIATVQALKGCSDCRVLLSGGSRSASADLSHRCFPSCRSHRKLVKR